MFNIQRFADTVTSSADLKFNWQFADGDTRLVTLPNPKSDLTATEVQAVIDSAVADGILIGDKAGAALAGVVQVYTENTTKTKLDLTTA